VEERNLMIVLPKSNLLKYAILAPQEETWNGEGLKTAEKNRLLPGVFILSSVEGEDSEENPTRRRVDI
jgi:hypothetical protein